MSALHRTLTRVRLLFQQFADLCLCSIVQHCMHSLTIVTWVSNPVGLTISGDPAEVNDDIQKQPRFGPAAFTAPCADWTGQPSSVGTGLQQWHCLQTCVQTSRFGDEGTLIQEGCGQYMICWNGE